MVRIRVTHVESDKSIEDRENAEAKPEGETPRPTHGYDPTALNYVGDIDPKQKLMSGGAETSLTPEIIGNVLKILPNTMNPAGFIMLMVNIMACYNFLSRSPLVLTGLMAAISELKSDHPELFEDGGYKKKAQEMYEASMKKRN